MNNMFRGATAFDQDIRNLNTFWVTDMSYMFYNASVFDRVIDWNVSSVANMASMFDGVSMAHPDSNKGLIHESLVPTASTAGTWPYDWREFVVINNSNFQTAVNLWFWRESA